jgi:hypothetical protein
MLTTLSTSGRTIARYSGFALCLVSALILLLFPAKIKLHDLNDHFRAPNACNEILRYTFVETVEAVGVAQVVKINMWPRHLFVVDMELKTLPRPYAEPVHPVPYTRLLLRLKLGPSPSSGQDPLI